MYPKRYKNHFSTKLISVILLTTIIPLILITSVFFQINITTARQKIIDALRLTNRQLIQQIEDRFTQMEKVSNTLQYYMYAFPSDDLSITEKMDAFSSLRTNISTLQSSFGFKHICVFLDSSSIFSKEGLMFFELEQIEKFNIPLDSLKNRYDDSVWYYTEQQYPFMLDKTFDAIPAVVCLRTLHNTMKDSINYIYFISIDAREFTDLLSTAYEDTGISAYLIDESGTVVACSYEDPAGRQDSFSAEQLEKFRTSDRYEDKNAHYFCNELSNGWIYVTSASHNYINANSDALTGIFILILLLVIPLAAFMLVLLTKNLTKRIMILSESASQVNFSQNQFHGTMIEYVKSIPESNFDEVDHLAVTYNKMMETIHENFDHITELRAQEASLKYRLLQSLINPHFLYNILDSIATCNRIGKPELANKMIMKLTKFYRMTLRKSNELITIRDELEIATLYMEMESICRGDNFTWDISMDDGIENFMICKFTLQPFIENSILHGMQGSNNHLHIQIDIRYGEDTILIFISDNGHGIPPEKLQELRESLQNGQIDTSKHFGICNVNARISSELFGYGFIEIDSTLGEGTFVKIEFQQILPE